MTADRRFASRKFILAAAAFVAGVVFYALKYMDASQWAAYTQWIVGLYMAGNVGDTVAEGVKR